MVITLPKLLSLAVIALGIALFFLTGCAPVNGITSDTSLYQSAVTGRAAVQATTPLITAGSIPVAVGKDVDISGRTVQSALGAWDTARKSGNADALSTAATAAEAALVTLEQKLSNLQAVAPPSVAGIAAKEKLQVHQLRMAIATDPKRKITAAAIITILDIAVTELPVLVNWINSAMNNHTVSDAQIETELAGFDSDLAVLEQALANKH